MTQWRNGTVRNNDSNQQPTIKNNQPSKINDKESNNDDSNNDDDNNNDYS